MECKAYNLGVATDYMWDLIETLWNVKPFCTYSDLAGSCDLIETLWNVKYRDGRRAGHGNGI